MLGRTVFFYVSILASLLLHIFDIGTDVLVTVGLFHSDKVYFWVSISIIITGALFSSIAAVLFGAARAVAEAAAKNGGNVDVESLPEPDLDATTIGSCLCGLTQLGIFFDAFFSLKEGKKTAGYAFSRLFEALVESSAQSLLQLYIAMKHSRRTGDSVQYEDMLLYVSIFTSVVSNAFGTWGFERWFVKKEMDIDIPKYSKYSVTLLFYRFFEVCARMGSLACIGIVLSGWAIGAILFFDWCFVVVTGWATLAYELCKNGLGGDKPHVLLFFSCMTSFTVVAFIGVFPLPFTITESEAGKTKESLGLVLQSLGRTFWLNKYLQETFAVVFIVIHMMNGDSNLVFRFFGRATIVAFVLQYFLLYFVLKWASAINPGCPTPSKALIFPCCRKLKQDELYSEMCKRGDYMYQMQKQYREYARNGVLLTGDIVKKQVASTQVVPVA